ncbi:MYXO-CTERM sorting domain-containing protein [Archangium sp.]|uniref:MYXO-CTERM sorting domain-containing protein n=1 Tax=Archangium sp. TaxID=1872627 RepID=UPI00286BF896|nr:MYXO-CTERM sorting domain-containing protein [Archangium sp.]
MGLGLVAGLVMLAAASAHADWRTNVPLTAAGQPVNPVGPLDVWAPQSFSVGTATGAVLVLDGGTSAARRISHGSEISVGTYYDPADDCFVSVDTTGQRIGLRANGTTCRLSQFANSNFNLPVVRVKQSSAGGGAVAVTMSLSSSEVFFADAGMSGATNAVLAYGESVALNGALGVRRVGDTLYAATGEVSTDGVVIWYADRGLTHRWALTSPGAGMVRALDVFSPDGVMPQAVVGTEKGFLRSRLTSVDEGIIEPVQWLAPGVGVASLSMNVESGGVNGHGFGMALLSLPDGGTSVASAVPMSDAGQAGTHWVPRPIPAADFTGATLRQVSCSQASYCVISAERGGVGTLFIYSNTSKPTLSTDASVPDGSVMLEEGQQQQLTFSAKDLDEDPVLLSASSLVEVPGSWSLEQVDAGVDGGWRPGDPLVMKLSGGNVCETGPVGRLGVHASDGRPLHDTDVFYPVYVKHTRPPQVPPVSRSKLQMFAGEADPLRFEVGAPLGGCALTGFQWSQVAGPVGLPGPTLVQEGSTAVLMAPANLCAQGGADFTYQLVVNDAAGLTSQPATFDVRVAPWGRPRTPFVNTAPVVVPGGQSRVLAPEPSLHVCENTAGFPGVETTWVLDGTPVENGGITLRDVASGAVVSEFPVLTGTAGLRLETAECLGTTTRLEFTAVNRTAGPGGLSSEPSTREVVVEPTPLTPIEQGTLGLQRESLSPEGVLSVRLAPQALNCVELRPELFAELQVGRTDGSGGVRREQVRVPGRWDVNLDPSCQGGRFRVTGALLDPSGKSSPVSSLEVELPQVPLGLETLPPTTLVASCGKGARTALTQTFPAGTCQTPHVTWTQVSGPPLAQASLQGSAVELATQDTGLDSLVGQSVVVKVAASVGSAPPVSREHALPITVEPFVRVRRRTELPAASETGLVGVSVELRNTSACGVSGVNYVERVTGLTYVEGSAQFNGEPVTATWVDGALTVMGLNLEAEGSGRLTYVARPHLVGERRMEGEARLNDVPITIREGSGPSVPVSGCGCTSGGSGPVLLALGALVVAVRRRRR